MVRLIALLILLLVLYYALRDEPKPEPIGYTPSIITVKELPPIEESK